jgi:glutamate-1-semialdehyde 2,1-aminomutase
MNLVPPLPGFLAGLRALCDAHGALLIFDEVMTGFRVAWGGAQELFDIRPDLTTLGKVIGGGLPLAAYGGRRDLMLQIAPAGPVYQAGTLSGNPLAVAAGAAALATLRRPEGCAYEKLESIGARIEEGLQSAARRHGVPLTVHRQGSMLGIFFTDRPIHRMEDVEATDRARFTRIFHRLLAAGLHLPPSAYEACFLSLAHGDEEVAFAIDAFDRALAEE